MSLLLIAIIVTLKLRRKGNDYISDRQNRGWMLTNPNNLQTCPYLPKSHIYRIITCSVSAFGLQEETGLCLCQSEIRSAIFVLESLSAKEEFILLSFYK